MNDLIKVTDTGTRLRQRMEELNLKQVELAEKSGIHKATISRYLSGGFEPKQHYVYALAKALDVNEMWLWGYNVPKERATNQKIRDNLAEIVSRLRTDVDFYELIVALNKLNAKQLESVNNLLAAFLLQK